MQSCVVEVGLLTTSTSLDFDPAGEAGEVLGCLLS